MGLFGSSTPTGQCYFCDGKAVSGENAAHCTNCGNCIIHIDCLKRNGLLKKEGHLIRSDKIKAKCPVCGNVGTLAKA